MGWAWTGIGVGNGSLGQETVHWGRLITCPNGCFRAPMRIPRSDRSGVPDWAVAEDASARSRSPRRAWETAAVGDKATVGSVLTAIAPAGPPAVLRQGDCWVCSHSDSAGKSSGRSATRCLSGLFSQRYRQCDPAVRGSGAHRGAFSQRYRHGGLRFHSGAPGFTAIPRRKCYSALGLLRFECNGAVATWRPMGH